MKKIICKNFPLILIAFFATCFAVQGQTYHSMPTAVQNLNDEAAFVRHQLSEVLEPGTNEYIANQEKHRFIMTMLREIKEENSVKIAAERNLPLAEVNKMQSAVKYFDSSFTGTTSNNYIRTELLSLIAY